MEPPAEVRLSPFAEVKSSPFAEVQDEVEHNTEKGPHKKTTTVFGLMEIAKKKLKSWDKDMKEKSLTRTYKKTSHGHELYTFYISYKDI